MLYSLPRVLFPAPFQVSACSDVSVFPCVRVPAASLYSLQRSSGAHRSRESTLATARLTYRRARLTAAPPTIPPSDVARRSLACLYMLPRPWPVMCVPASRAARCGGRGVGRAPVMCCCSGAQLFRLARGPHAMCMLPSFVCEFSSIYLPLITTSRDCLVLRSRTRTKHML